MTYTYSQTFRERMEKARANKPAGFGGKGLSMRKVRYERYNPKHWDHFAAYQAGAFRFSCEEVVEAFREGIFGKPEPIDF